VRSSAGRKRRFLDKMLSKAAKKLRRQVLVSLRKQGYEVRRGLVRIPSPADKSIMRGLHGMAVAHRITAAEKSFFKKEDRLIPFIANGSEIQPKKISPRLELVEPDTDNELLFRYASLHWSIPVSSGYGRRLRFLVFDDQNDRLIGLFGLGDPVYALHDRDKWIGWDSEQKRERLYHVLDAYVLGAVPPYSMLLGGKMVAMLALSNEVRRAFKEKYFGTKTLINKKKRPPYLSLITTTSALGRSSLYNRIRVDSFDYWHSVGFTKGFGEFHFSNGMYGAIREFVEERCEPTAKQAAWGIGFRNKREVVRKCLPKLDLSPDLLHHGIEREVFAAPLGRNTLRFLKGEVSRPGFFDWRAKDLAELCMERWILPRASRRPEYALFERSDYRLWREGAS
jgi:hypothetical protein